MQQVSYEFFSAVITFLLEYKLFLKCFDYFNSAYQLSQHLYGNTDPHTGAAESQSTDGVEYDRQECYHQL